jgi:hypothetical protein
MTKRAEIARSILPVPEALVFEADEYLFTLAAAMSEVALSYMRVLMIAGVEGKAEAGGAGVVHNVAKKLRNLGHTVKPMFRGSHTEAKLAVSVSNF